MKGLLLTALLATTILMSCKKDSDVGIVGITVVNEKGVPIQNCNVKLTVPVSPGVEWGVDYFYGTTNEDGYIEFQKKNHSFFDVYVWKGLWEGCDFVEFVPNEIRKKDIIIFPPGSQFNGCL